jgi:hypothetical protein
MKRIIRLTERDLTRLIKRIVKENEDEMGDMYTDFGRKKIPTKYSEDISYDIQSVDCGDNIRSGHVDIDDDNETIVIRYCEGNEEDLKYLKEKGMELLRSQYNLPDEDDTLGY